MHFVFLYVHITCPVVLISGLPDGADINNSLLGIDNRVDITELGRQIEVRLIKKDTGHVSMAYEADVLDSLE